MGKRAKFQRKIFNFTVAGSLRSFQFFRQNTCFFKNEGALSKFSYDIFLCLTSINELQKKSVIKTNLFY